VIAKAKGRKTLETEAYGHNLCLA